MKAMSCLGMVVTVAIVALVSIFVGGWALSTVWNWFMPATFASLPHLTFGQALGVSMVFTLFTGSHTNKKKDVDTANKSFEETVLVSIITILFTNAFYVGFAWIILQFVF